MPEDQPSRRHLFISGSGEAKPFTSPSSGGSAFIPPERARAQHARRLSNQLNVIRGQAAEAAAQRQDFGLDPGIGIKVLFEGAENFDLPFESLARDSQGIELLNVQKKENQTSATVFVPTGKLDHFERLIIRYKEEETTSGKPKNLKLINSIEQIREAAFSELWTDDDSVLPEDDGQLVNWEIWLPVRKDRQATISQFRQQAELLGLTVSGDHLEFPERTVIAVQGTMSQIRQSAQLLDYIAEIRRVKETADFFVDMGQEDQAAFANDLLDRTNYSEGEATYISVLDTGVNNGHPLLLPILEDRNCHTIEPAWGTDDRDGHGTGMAGLAIYGDLTNVLGTTDVIEINHRLESVKILRQDGDNANKHHGTIIEEAIARLEVEASERNRIICMAVTSEDNRDQGRPSAWSATIDSLASGALDETQRLILVSAGNVDPANWANFPDGNLTDGIHDPGQSWNALTIGAYTNKGQINDDAVGYEALATPGDLSPHSTTSCTWNSAWPLKPDVVFEGGNIAQDQHSCVTMGSLELTTTYHQPAERLFDHFNATSAATALASEFAAKITSTYSNLWPETIRGLIVHSARWTESMCNEHLPAAPNTSNYEQLVRACGFGVPSIDKALWSLSNALTLVAEDSIQPFWKQNGSYKTKDMNLHSLPWPKDSLLALGETEVTLRVTLSYFVEPNPSERGFSGRYRYASHGLRFDMRRPDETQAQFEQRINRAARDEESGSRFGGAGDGWFLGKQKRHRGSLHSDVWSGTAAELANREHIAVYPAIGWWRERHHLLRFEKSTRYSLLISIECPETDVDLYHEIAIQLEVPIEIEV